MSAGAVGSADVVSGAFPVWASAAAAFPGERVSAPSLRGPELVGGGVLEAGGSPRVGSWCSLLGRCPGARVWVLAARSYVWSAVGGGGGSGTLLCLVLFGHKIRRGGVRAEKSSDLEQFVKEGVVFLE